MSRRGLLALLLWAALVAGCVLQILRTPFTADLSAFLPANPDAQQRLLIEQLQSGLPARTLLIAIEGGDAAQRVAASRALARGLRDSGLFEQVQNGQTESMAGWGEWLFNNRYALSPAVDAQRFSAAGLRDAIEDTLSLLGTPAGQALKRTLDRDPTGETLRIAETLIPARAPRTDQGVWVSRNDAAGAPARALLVALSKAPGADLDAQQRAIAQVRETFAATTQAGLTLKISGAPLFAVNSRAQIETEVRNLSIAGTVLLSGLLLLAFGSLRALGLALLPVATGVLCGISAVSLVFGGVHGITLGFGATLIGEAVDYAIYYLIQARAGGAAHWLQRGWPTVRLGLLTSICGFGALVFSGFPGLAQLGVFTVAGLAGAAMFTRFVLTELAPLGSPGMGLRKALGQFALRAIDWLPRLRWPLLALGVAAAALLLQRPTLWSAELSSLSPVSQEALELDASLRAELSAGDSQTLVVVQGATLQATLESAEAAAARLDALRAQGAIAGFDTVSRWLPSLALQGQRMASLPEAPALQTALAQATQGGPLGAQRLAPFVTEVQAARLRAPVDIASLRAAGLGSLVDALLLQRKDGSWAALLPLQPAAAPVDADRVRKALTGLAGTDVIEIGPELKRLYARYLGQAQAQALLGALGVIALIALTLRSPRRVLSVCQPLALSVLLCMGVLVLSGVQLGILHLVGLLLVVAVGSNYALFFEMLQRQGATGQGPDPDTLASLLLANLTTVLSFGLIALSGIPALSAIGRVVALGALLALVLAAAFTAPRRADLQPPSP